ncbi:MAG TPA: hypothetical protein VMG59_06935 [Phycisphaerae bacterium]|nr:hypothetical protein [Phycisphaerae bacterium]
MDAAEHIVDCYYRFVKKCFTINDVKVLGGVNRQLDILAINPKTKDQYHIECSVTHDLNWAPKEEQLKDVFEYKFLGVPKKAGRRRINYKKNILETYRAYGLSPSKIQRVFACWIPHHSVVVEDFLEKFKQRHNIKITILNLRDDVIRKLFDSVGTAYYDDEILRLVGFLKQRESQLLKKG